jgi:hypothetical protein
MNYKDFRAEDFLIIPQSDKINARILDLEENKSFKVFVFSEKAGVYSCLLPVNDTKTQLPEMKGLFIKYEQYKMPGSMMEWYVLIECRTEAYLVNFTEILKEIIGEIDKCKHETVKCIQLIISKWRLFLSTPKDELMKEEDIIGLIGELMMLEKLIVDFDINAINYWVADRGEEDIIKDDCVIEVKTTLKEKHEHVINGIDQLLIIPSRSKYILSILLVRSENGTNINLPFLVQNCSQKFAEYPDIIESFYRKLKLRGYDLRDTVFYHKYNYGFVKGGYFLVDDKFPSLTSSDLIQPLNSRISKVRYLLDIEGLINKDFVLTPIKELFI